MLQIIFPGQKKTINKISINIPLAVQVDRQETRPCQLVKHHLPVVAELQQIESGNKALITDPSIALTVRKWNVFTVTAIY